MSETIDVDTAEGRAKVLEKLNEELKDKSEDERKSAADSLKELFGLMDQAEDIASRNPETGDIIKVLYEAADNVEAQRKKVLAMAKDEDVASVIYFYGQQNGQLRVASGLLKAVAEALVTLAVEREVGKPETLAKDKPFTDN